MPTSEKSTTETNEPFSLLKIILTFFSIIAIRLFLDNLAYPNSGNYFYPTERFIQAPLYFFSVFFSLAILTYFLSKKPFGIILTFLTKVFLFILTVPLIDLLLSGTVPEALKYITVGTHELLPTFFQIMNPFSGQGITVGQHFAAYGIFISIAIFVFKETKSFYKLALSILLGYAILFFHAII